MFDTQSIRPRTLHNISHVLQSLLMRLQADFFILEKKTHQEQVVPVDSQELAQHVERSKRTIKQMSLLIEHVFECLYLANEPRNERIQSVPFSQWQTALAEQTKLLAPLMKVKTSAAELTLRFDVQLVNWMIGMVVRSLVQLADQTKPMTLRVLPSGSAQIMLEISFVPRSESQEGVVLTPQQEQSPIAEFYWSAAQLSSEHLHATLSQRADANMGRASITLSSLQES